MLDDVQPLAGEASDTVALQPSKRGLEIIKRDIRKKLTQGWTLAHVRQRYSHFPWAILADLYFEVRSERDGDYSPRLKRQLNEIAAKTGQPQAAIARQALETLAASRLIHAAAWARVRPLERRLSVSP